jgi:hypothetical protein
MDGTLYMLVPLSPSCRNRSCKSRAKLRAKFAQALQRPFGSPATLSV